jgi:thiamine-monophosphate kinase
MDERDALGQIAKTLPQAGDDAAVISLDSVSLVITTDMLHETTDFPDGTTRYTAGWRAVGASLSDIAAMGGQATAAVAVYGAPAFDPDEIDSFIAGAIDVCDAANAQYVGGDLDTTSELTIATTALGTVTHPSYRHGARIGDCICVTGNLGRTAAGLKAFETGDIAHANELFRFTPRVNTGAALAKHTTAMMDSSDGLARSVHQLASASEVGMSLHWDAIPTHPDVKEYVDDVSTRRELTTTVGEDFELVLTLPSSELANARETTSVPLHVIGEVTESDRSGEDGASVLSYRMFCFNDGI